MLQRTTALGRRARALALASLFLLATACMRKPVQVLDQTIPLPEAADSYYLVRPAKGRACQFTLFYFIPIGGNQLWKAKDRAVGDDSDGLIDVTVDAATAFTPLGPVVCTDVRGLAVRYGQPPAGYGPVVLRERVKVREEVVYREVEVPAGTAPPPVASAPLTTSSGPGASADLALSLRYGGGAGYSLRTHLPIPLDIGADQRLDAGIGFDQYPGTGGLQVPLQVRYLNDALLPQDMTLYGLLEVGALRYPMGGGWHAGTGVGASYPFAPYGSAFLEVGYPNLRLGAQYAF